MKYIWVIFILIGHGVQAQHHAIDSLIPAHQFSFSTGLNLQQPMKIETFAGKQQMLPFSYLTPELIGFQYTRHIKGPFSVQIGAHIALYRFSEKIKIDKEDLTMFPDLADEDYERHEISWIRYPSYSFPIYIHANLFSRNNFLFTSGLGVKFNYFYSVAHSAITGPATDTSSHIIFQVNMQSTQFEKRKVWFPSICLKLGATFFTQKLHTLTCHLSVNYTPSYIKEGEFAFYYVDNASHGTVKQRNNYISLEFAYGFGKKRKLRPERFTLF